MVIRWRSHNKRQVSVCGLPKDTRDLTTASTRPSEFLGSCQTSIEPSSKANLRAGFWYSICLIRDLQRAAALEAACEGYAPVADPVKAPQSYRASQASPQGTDHTVPL
jgi:hypothetical protein